LASDGDAQVTDEHAPMPTATEMATAVVGAAQRRRRIVGR
jgi:hypothetical protein